MKRLGMLVCIVTMVFLTSIVTGDSEPNDDFGDAEEVISGVYAGQLDCGLISCDNYDYYKVTLVAGQMLYLNLTSTPETSVTLYDEQKDIEYFSVTKTDHEILRVTSSSAPPTSVHYVEISRVSGEGSYTLEVSIVSQNDANSGGDAGDRFETATFVADGTQYSGFDYSFQDDDYYAIGVQQRSEVVVDLWSNRDESAEAYVYDGERHTLADIYVTYNAHDNATFEVSEPQTVYVRISTKGTYEFQITLNDVEDSDDATDDAIDVLSLLFQWMPYIIVIVILVFVVVAIIAVAKRR